MLRAVLSNQKTTTSGVASSERTRVVPTSSVQRATSTKRRATKCVARSREALARAEQADGADRDNLHQGSSTQQWRQHIGRPFGSAQRAAPYEEQIVGHDHRATSCERRETNNRQRVTDSVQRASASDGYLAASQGVARAAATRLCSRTLLLPGREHDRYGQQCGSSAEALSLNFGVGTPTQRIRFVFGSPSSRRLRGQAQST